MSQVGRQLHRMLHEPKIQHFAYDGEYMPGKRYLLGQPKILLGIFFSTVSDARKLSSHPWRRTSCRMQLVPSSYGARIPTTVTSYGRTPPFLTSLFHNTSEGISQTETFQNLVILFFPSSSVSPTNTCSKDGTFMKEEIRTLS